MLEPFISGLALLSSTTRTPGIIVGPVANFLGVIYNAVFNFIYGFVQANSLGIAIILFTLLVKTVLIPLSYKQQKSTFAMQKLQPEMNKIKEKYSGKKDAESQQKMALEMQKLQKDNNISMFGGCLPLLVQLPILYALFYIFQQAYLYIDVVGMNYQAITDLLLSMPVDLRLDVFTDIINEHDKACQRYDHCGLERRYRFHRRLRRSAYSASCAKNTDGNFLRHKPCAQCGPWVPGNTRASAFGGYDVFFFKNNYETVGRAAKRRAGSYDAVYENDEYNDAYYDGRYVYNSSCRHRYLLDCKQPYTSMPDVAFK